MILGKSLLNPGADLATDRLIPSDAALRVPLNNHRELADAIDLLCDHPELRESMSKRMTEEAKKILWSWDERVAAEVNMLKQLVIECKGWL